MQFLKSLFCLQGFDNRSRFFAICSTSYVVFIMLSSAFASSLFISLSLLVLFAVTLGLTSLRRLHDAKLNKNWLFAPSLTFVFVATIIIFSQQNSSYYLLLIPVLCSAILLTYPSTGKLNFILGYFGPVDLKEYQQETHQRKQAKFRIEPTLINDNTGSSYSSVNIDNTQSAQQSYNVEQNHYAQNTPPQNQQADIGELIRLKVLSNTKAPFILTAIIVLLLIAAVGGNYYYGQESVLLRAVGVVVAVGIAGLIAMQTLKGRTAVTFAKESRTEVRKVVWPTRQEAIQTTGIVLVVTLLMSLLLWGLDSVLFWVVGLITGMKVL